MTIWKKFLFMIMNIVLQTHKNINQLINKLYNKLSQIIFNLVNLYQSKIITNKIIKMQINNKTSK